MALKNKDRTRRTLRLDSEHDYYLKAIKEELGSVSENYIIQLTLKNYYENVLNGKYSQRKKFNKARDEYIKINKTVENGPKNSYFDSDTVEITKEAINNQREMDEDWKEDMELQLEQWRQSIRERKK